ncbi:TetR/AcrR family transcriptional regulator [Ktedonosporobacter rubrisoli]|uniref:TetR/AcrR family transcriptional regulator n=1 Tax=Ktedonosporobacter rubrisoli TaxID=2509675 RepID=A0A4P6JJZ1_KTERU|nr:TetR-like C-terminal domain-containing protein [Ktedonosporobacter rubrisoli]QBD75449.1 TetR/AcrR family transcriptional regulator [Ktedonosporobacter rubrisoli]
MATRAGLDHKMVVQAAAELADANGLAELSLATLASKLGVRTPTLYHYIRDGLSGLHRELALRGCQEIAQRLGKAIMGKSGEEAIRALAHTYRTFVKEHPGLYAALVPAAPKEDTALQQAQTEVVEIVVRAFSAYHMSEPDTIHTVRILRSLVHGFTTTEVSGGFGLPLDIDETFERLLSVFLRGLAG